MESVLQGWCLQAQWIEEALEELRGHLEPQLQRLSLQIRGRALGECQVCSNTNIAFLVTFFSFQAILCGRDSIWRSFACPEISVVL